MLCVSVCQDGVMLTLRVSLSGTFLWEGCRKPVLGVCVMLCVCVCVCVCVCMCV